ncbi:MAG: DUF2075 domain-containing protein [Fimbriimonadales bacterium]
MNRYYYSNDIGQFLVEDAHSILGVLAANNPFTLEISQRTAWLEQIWLLKNSLKNCVGRIYFEYSIPRMGRRIDAVLVIGPVVFILEFKVGANTYLTSDCDQVCDYSLDLKNFHASSHHPVVVPILIATAALEIQNTIAFYEHLDRLIKPLRSNGNNLSDLIARVLEFAQGEPIDPETWEAGSYSPTPTIVEAAVALYGGHAVEDISRSDAGAQNLRVTSEKVDEIIQQTKQSHEKAICFVTGVPGSGKTLIGLDIASKNFDPQSELYSVFLSGNGPLVAVLHEALARDRVRSAKESGEKIKKGEALSEVKAFVQNVHHFRDEYLRDPKPPIEHVVLFDEAQRAWNLHQTANFMKRKKNVPDFQMSEPEFLISCLDRHPDWAVIVCLVGGGQEINTGEAGIRGWIEAIERSYRHWKVYISSRLTDKEFDTGDLTELLLRAQARQVEEMHLGVSMRSFRAENVSHLVKSLLDKHHASACQMALECASTYPIALTRDIGLAKAWVRAKARGSERTGVVVSSQAERLRPQGIHVKAPMNPVHWFLARKDDVRSSYYLEDVATEFHVQGLEIDWACVAWDADLRVTPTGWQHWSFSGDKWKKIHQEDRRRYQLNAYRVLLTRARQGMVIVVPPGDKDDHTRCPSFYDPTFEYLAGLGFEILH